MCSCPTQIIPFAPPRFRRPAERKFPFQFAAPLVIKKQPSLKRVCYIEGVTQKRQRDERHLHRFAILGDAVIGDLRIAVVHQDLSTRLCEILDLRGRPFRHQLDSPYANFALRDHRGPGIRNIRVGAIGLDDDSLEQRFIDRVSGAEFRAAILWRPFDHRKVRLVPIMHRIDSVVGIHCHAFEKIGTWPLVVGGWPVFPMVPMFVYGSIDHHFPGILARRGGFSLASLPFHLPLSIPGSAAFIVHNTLTSRPEESKIPALVNPGYQSCRRIHKTSKVQARAWVIPSPGDWTAPKRNQPEQESKGAIRQRGLGKS